MEKSPWVAEKLGNFRDHRKTLMANRVEYIPSGMETVRQEDFPCVIWSDPTRNRKAGGLTDLSGIAVAKLSEHLDEFKAHPNNINWVRWQYKEILADIAEANVLDDLLSQIYGVPGSFNKLSFNLADLIREGEYGLA